MKKDQVIDALGPPEAVQIHDEETEVITYTVSIPDMGKALQCSGAALQGAPLPPICDEEIDSYTFLVTLRKGEVVEYQRIEAPRPQPSYTEQEQYYRDHSAWQTEEAARQEKWRQQQAEAEAKERNRFCQDAIRRHKSGYQSIRQVETACTR